MEHSIYPLLSKISGKKRNLTSFLVTIKAKNNCINGLNQNLRTLQITLKATL